MGAKEQGADTTNERWLTVPRTLCFITNGDDVLLMKRAANRRIFPNRYNGVGGHVEHDEDPLSCIKREIQEETGLVVRDIQLRAIYNVDAGESVGIVLFVFTAVSDTREVVTDHGEGTRQGVPGAMMMELDLVADLPQLLPRIFSMKAGYPPLFVHVSYNSDDVIQMRFADA